MILRVIWKRCTEKWELGEYALFILQMFFLPLSVYNDPSYVYLGPYFSGKIELKSY